jgi:hypothetical protein
MLLVNDERKIMVEMSNELNSIVMSNNDYLNIIGRNFSAFKIENFCICFGINFFMMPLMDG